MKKVKMFFTVNFRVSDTGVGIAAAELPKILLDLKPLLKHKEEKRYKKE
jgi:signal transduction histidine kinase